MSNKYSLKKLIMAAVLITVCFGTVIAWLGNRYIREYNQTNNERLEAILLAVHERYPELTGNDIMDILDSEYATANNSESFLAAYGVDISEDTIVISNSSLRRKIIGLCVAVFLLEGFSLLVFFVLYERRRYKEIGEITKCIENINHKIYHLDIDSNTEDELSILKNEIYKTTLMLKEDAENSKESKKLLKDSLSDISHQLKTPLTSITIMLDNLYENPDMEATVRKKFLRNMRRELSNINFMVQSLLKLSKLEADAVSFNVDDISLEDIVKESVKNVAALSDLRDVQINVAIPSKEYIINCDRKWQIEAVSNILKNSVEHSNPGSSVDISMDDNHVFTSLVITNYGETISEKDLSHIFERFYMGENATADSVGIGLALAKSIVEGCGGDISVDSADGKTSFKIRYYK